MTLDGEQERGRATLKESNADILVTALCKKFRTFGISINLNMLVEIAHKWQAGDGEQVMLHFTY